MYQRKKGKGMVAVDLSSEIKKNGKYSIFLELRYVMPKSPPVSPILKSMHECTERNILFLSETGNGKSTFINAFKNYVTYPSFDDALKAARAGESMFLVPASFSISLNGKHQSVRVGDPDDKNENTTFGGGSATRASATYVFESSVGRLGLVDTPGMGDTEGLDKDKMNVANIVSHLSSIENIHCICILLKPNCHLHKSAVNNIVFCFTGSRGTQYQPGDTLDALKALLAEVEEKYGVKIALTDSTKYCLDNDSFRFLVHLLMASSTVRAIASAWLPTLLNQTVELNEARRIIEVVSPVLAKISQSIQSNLSALKMREEELQKIDIMQEGVADKLMVPVVTMEVRQLDHPRTVCAAGKHMTTVTGSDGEYERFIILFVTTSAT
uniref:G domain-containing protein n=1 Tax=Ditylenchus dipsaci TaxID=166011 RepID=A0A915CUQ5_9BILA